MTCALVPRAFFLDLSLASPNVRWGLSRPITSENGLLGQAEDFNLLGHPAEQRGEFYKLKCVGWCVGWLRRVRRVTLLALHQLTCRRLDNEHSLTMLGCAELLWLGVFALVPCLSHCLCSFALAPLPWSLCLGVGLVWILWLGFLGLELRWPRSFGVAPLAWLLWLCSFSLAPLAGFPWLGPLWLGFCGLAPLTRSLCFGLAPLPWPLCLGISALASLARFL